MMCSDMVASRQLLELSVAGDPVALEQLLLSHYDWLSLRLQRQIPTDLQGLISADDVLQETFVRVFSSIRRFDPESDASFPQWLKTIADHQLVDSIRRRRRERLADRQRQPQPNAIHESWLGSLIEQVADDGTPPLRGAILGELHRIIPVALARLPDDYRNVLRLLYLEGRPPEEVAAAMDRTPDAVRGLCYRARKQLREVLLRLSYYV